jgi:hypothetical protein
MNVCLLLIIMVGCFISGFAAAILFAVLFAGKMQNHDLGHR